MSLTSALFTVGTGHGAPNNKSKLYVLGGFAASPLKCERYMRAGPSSYPVHFSYLRGIRVTCAGLSAASMPQPAYPAGFVQPCPLLFVRLL
jgi:hypothetical protein